MKYAHSSLGLAILIWLTSSLWGTSAIGQNRWFAQCDPNCDPCAPVEPCDPVDPCDPVCGSKFFRRPGLDAASFNVSGWVDFGVYTNAHGFNNNGPLLTDSQRRTDFGLNQLYLVGEKTLNSRRGIDWGARTDLVYGTHAGSMQSFGDEKFDFGLGTNRHGYDLAVYQLYGSVGYKNLNVQIGKFITTCGWEGSASRDNFFQSHSFCYMFEPATHTGILANYDISDRLSLHFGYTTGMDSTFKNPYSSHAVLTGFNYTLADNVNIYYAFNGGRQGYAGEEDGAVDLDNYFFQSLCMEWRLTDRFTYVIQYNLRNDTARDGTNRRSTYAINNHFLYKLTDQWGAGMRFEWMRDNGSWNVVDGVSADYYQMTWGLNWRPFENLLIRPELRYDWVHGATPFGPAETFGGFAGEEGGIRSTQLSGACGVVLTF